MTDESDGQFSTSEWPPRSAPICRVFWGSHGCGKRWPHLGSHRCSPGCWSPSGTDRIFGEDALAEYAGADDLARRQLLNAPASRPVVATG